jgi:hypothetical protein
LQFYAHLINVGGQSRRATTEFHQTEQSVDHLSPSPFGGVNGKTTFDPIWSPETDKWHGVHEQITAEYEAGAGAKPEWEILPTWDAHARFYVWGIRELNK